MPGFIDDCMDSRAKKLKYRLKKNPMTSMKTKRIAHASGVVKYSRSSFL